MEAVSHKVDGLSSPDRRVLENLVGRPLARDEHVVVIAFQPGERDEAMREAARVRVREMIEKAVENASAAGVTAGAADEAIAEAMRAIRPRATH